MSLFFDMGKANAILKHFYGGAHREYPRCEQCTAWDLESLRARRDAWKRKHGTDLAGWPLRDSP